MVFGHKNTTLRLSSRYPSTTTLQDAVLGVGVPSPVPLALPSALGCRLGLCASFLQGWPPGLFPLQPFQATLGKTQTYLLIMTTGSTWHRTCISVCWCSNPVSPFLSWPHLWGRTRMDTVCLVPSIFMATTQLSSDGSSRRDRGLPGWTPQEQGGELGIDTFEW